MMSFVLPETRDDIENSLTTIMPECVHIHADTPVNANSFAFLFTVLLIFVVLNSQQMSPNLLLWLVFGFFMMATSIRMYATCQQLHAQAQAHELAASDLRRHTELWFQMPQLIAFASRGHLQGLRLQLDHLDREFDDLDYGTLRAVDVDNVPSAYSMSEEQINVLSVHTHEVTCSQSAVGEHASSSSSTEKQLEISINVGSFVGLSEDELTCSVCLEQVNAGELIRSLPCLHQFHANCIDPWLRQQGTCPVCKDKVWTGSREEFHVDVDVDASYMV